MAKWWNGTKRFIGKNWRDWLGGFVRSTIQTTVQRKLDEEIFGDKNGSPRRDAAKTRTRKEHPGD